MPMDIRSFFAKKGGAVAAAAKSSDNKEEKKKKKSRSKSATSRKTTTPLSPIDEEGPSSKAAKKKRQYHLDSDSEEDCKKPAVKDEEDDSGSATEGEEEVVPKKKAKADSKATSKPELKEVSTSDFFASASTSATGKRSSTRKSKPKRSYVLGDSEDEEEEKESEDYRGGNDEDDEEDDDMEIEEETKPASRNRSPKVARNPPSKPVRKPSPFKKQKVEKEADEDDVLDLCNSDSDAKEKKLNETPTRASNSRSKRAVKSPPAEETPPSTKKRKTPTSSSKKPPASAKKEPLIEPTLELESFNVDDAVSECMAGTTFVFTGVLEGMAREDGMDFVKTLGGRVTTAVSSKTSYLVVGEVLEDGRPYTEGSKYRRAKELGTIIVMGENKLKGLGKLYNDRALPPPVADKENNENKESSTTTAAKAPPKKAVVNPYAKKATIANPYAKKKPAANNPYAKKAAPKADDALVGASKFGANDLWVDKYAPVNTRNILGNKEQVTKLTAWLANWERKFNNSKAVGKAFSNPKGPWKAALLSGPPGIGKTTTATLVGKEAGRDVLEFNASDVRSKKVMSQSFGDIIGSQSIEGHFQKVDSNGKVGKPSQQKKLRCLIFDEVDGMSAGDRGGMAELIQMIKHSRVPIICICNDRQSQKMKSLLPYCFDLRFRRPTKNIIARAAVRIASTEGLQVELNAAEAVAESCGNDIRQVVNCLQMWASEKQTNTMTYKGLKEREHSINKDEILRVSLFDAAKLILEGRKGLNGADADAERSSFFKRNDAFFTDYSFTGLIVQQNYLKLLNPQYMEVKRANDDDKMLEMLDRVHEAAHTMSDYAMVESNVRGGSMNWGLLPFSGTLVVKTGFHASGPNGANYPGFPEFTTWLGRNSSKGKKQRILQELNHHMNYKISGGTQEVRLSYLPFMRQRFYTQLKESKEEDRNAVAIELMDDYGLDRDDIFENLDEFKMDKSSTLADVLDSKEKAAFTREYNKGSHKSQALVDEQGAPKKTKRKGGAKADPEDPDAIDDDNFEEEDEEEEEDMEKLRAAFKKKGRKAAAKTAAKGKGRGKKK